MRDFLLMYQGGGAARSVRVMPSTELVRDPPRRPVRRLLGAARLAPARRHAGEGARARDDQPLLGRRSRPHRRRARRAPAARGSAARARACCVGWGVGGVVADALAAPGRAARASSCSTGSRPGALNAEPDEAQLLRSFAMYAGARRGRTLTVDPARLSEGLEPASTHILERGDRAPARCARTPRPRRVRRCYDEHAARASCATTG